MARETLRVVHVRSTASLREVQEWTRIASPSGRAIPQVSRDPSGRQRTCGTTGRRGQRGVLLIETSPPNGRTLRKRAPRSMLPRRITAAPSSRRFSRSRTASDIAGAEVILQQFRGGPITWVSADGFGEFAAVEDQRGAEEGRG